MYGPVILALMQQSSANQEPTFHAYQDFEDETVGEAAFGDLMELDSGFLLPPPALDFFDLEGAGGGAIPVIAPSGGLDLDVEGASTAIMDQISASGRFSDDLDWTMYSGMTPMASSLCSGYPMTDDLTRGTSLSTPGIRFSSPLSHTLEEPMPPPRSIGDLKLRREHAILAVLFQCWVVSKRAALGVQLQHRLLQASQTPPTSAATSVSAECAHRVGGRRVAFRSSRRAPNTRGVGVAYQRAQQQATCAARSVQRMEAENAIFSLRRSFRGTVGRHARGLLS